jgi:hypothetical protein
VTIVDLLSSDLNVSAWRCLVQSQIGRPAGLGGDCEGPVHDMSSIVDSGPGWDLRRNMVGSGSGWNRADGLLYVMF